MYNIDKIFQVMKDNKTTAKELASAIGVSEGNFSAWKKGRNKPSGTIVLKIANHFGMSIEDFLTEPADKKNSAPSEQIDSKEAFRQVLYKEGIIPADRILTNEEKEAILAFAEAFIKRRENQ